MSKHTPGPWTATAYESGVVAVSDANRGLCVLTGGTFESRQADARLIAAAPAMLEALRTVSHCVADAEGGVTLGYVELQEIRAAIKAAEGST